MSRKRIGPVSIDSLPNYLSPKDAADQLRYSQQKIYRLVRKGTLPCLRVGWAILIPREAVDRLVA